LRCKSFRASALRTFDANRSGRREATAHAPSSALLWSTIRLVERLQLTKGWAPYWIFLVLGVANAVLYANLQPLWEGFDEAFHYAFVEHVATRGALPVFGSTHVALDVEESLRLAPAAPPVRVNLPYVMTYSEYFALSDEGRSARRAALWRIPSAWREQVLPGANMNYEAQQAPLAYLVLAPLDALWAGTPLAARVLRLRLVCAITAVLLCFAAALRLAKWLEMDRAATSFMLLLLLSAQMFYGATAHVANDWLSVSLSAWFFAALARYLDVPATSAAFWLGFIAGAGVLTKASFLSWAAVGALAVLASFFNRRARPAHVFAYGSTLFALAAPWFARNYHLYGGLSVMQQTMRGATIGDTVSAALRMPWGETVAAQLRGALWTGNSSFNSFSRLTLNVVLTLLAMAFAAWLVTLRRSRCRPLEQWIAIALGVFCLALAYACAVFHVSRPDLPSLMPWHTVAAFLPLACLLACGLRRSRAWGKWLAATLAAGFVYLNIATYVLKLIPQYAGCGEGHIRWREFQTCYCAAGDRTMRLLADTALGPAWLIGGLTALVSALALYLGAVTIGRWFGRAEQS